jgi:structure-specific recognition protein 1
VSEVIKMQKKGIDEENKAKGNNKEDRRRSRRLKDRESTEKRNEIKDIAKNSSTKKEEKKGRDPAAPKKANSAYNCFVDAKWKKVKDDNPGMNVRETNKELGNMWKHLNEKKKKEYVKMAKEAKDK